MAVYILVERECKCGCGNRFRVLPTSGHWYSSVTHRPDFQAIQFSTAIGIDHLRRVKKWLAELYGDVDSESTLLE